MAQMHHADAWQPHLAGFDAVIYSLGVFRADDESLYLQLHHTIPAALFDACTEAGIERVIYLSALGSDSEAITPYWRSKGRGEDALRTRQLDYTIVRPSLVYGADGASSQMFLALASLPVVALPAGGKVQPVHVDDLCDAITALLRPEHRHVRTLDAVGPNPMPLSSYLADLRHGMRSGGELMLPAPLGLARAALRLTSLFPYSAVTPDALVMLQHGSTADASAMHALLGRPLRAPATFATPAQRADAVLRWSLPLARLAMTMLWLWTAYVSWFGWPHKDSLAWLAACGIPASLQTPVLACASVLDAAIGIVLLCTARRWLWLLQLLLVGGYTAAMTVCLPEFWLHPFGPLSKNWPILALLLMLWRLHPAKQGK
ncbi:NAD(P)H-binding protein [Pseudoduganella ginsengisoli]